MAKLAPRLMSLRARLRLAQARVDKAQCNVDEIEAEIASRLEQFDLARIRAWRGKPDWSVLLDSNHTSIMYMLCSYMLQRMGLSTGSKWTDTGQLAVCIHVPAADGADGADGAMATVARVADAVSAIAGHLVPQPDGRVRFLVMHRKPDRFALQLHMTKDGSRVSLRHLEFQQIKEERLFDDLREALVHIQAEHPAGDPREWGHDPSDAPGSTGEALRAGLTAFMDGCRSAGMPIDATVLGGGQDGALERQSCLSLPTEEC